MLRTNLSTRPFYNIRAVRLALALAAVVVTAITIFNIVQSISLNAREGELSSRATEALADADRVRADARRIRSQVNQAELTALSSAAEEANFVIEQRAFSWSRLLSEIEAALPDDVRVTKVDPRIDDENRIIVGITIEAQQVEDYAAFMEGLERGGRFSNVLPKSDSRAEDDIIDVLIEGRYQVPAVPVEKAIAPTNAAETEGDKP